MIDLHTHTTASDGQLAPDALVDAARTSGVTVLGLTDHDTVAGLAEAARACERLGMEFVPGIEITAVADGRDVHVLGYFLDAGSPELLRFLVDQRRVRVARIETIVARLAEFGIDLDADAILQPARTGEGRSPGRPWVARALVAAGHVASVQEAFDRWLATGRPAFIPREGAPPSEVVQIIARARGLSSLAHPGLTKRDELIAPLSDAGLTAIECYHTDHAPDITIHYLGLAARFGLAVTGGSDYHADAAHGAPKPGFVSLPADAFARLKALAVRSRK